MSELPFMINVVDYNKAMVQNGTPEKCFYNIFNQENLRPCGGG